MTPKVTSPAVKAIVCVVWVTFYSPDWIIFTAVRMFVFIIGNCIRSLSKYYIEHQIKYIGMSFVTISNYFVKTVPVLSRF